MNENKQIAMHFLGAIGKLISGSKSRYRENHPDNIAIFNANVCTKDEKVWWGDLDVTLSKDNLSSLAIALNTDIYVLLEMDGRFENEESPLIENHQFKFTPSGEVVKGKRCYWDQEI